MKMFGFDTLDWRQVKIDWDAITDDIIKAGTPMDKDGHICNDGNVFGILMDDVQRKRNVQGRVVISGCMDMKAAEEHSGITLSAEAKAALPDVWTQSGASSWNDLTDKPFGIEEKEMFFIEETTVEFAEGQGMAYAKAVLVPGDTYTVMWDGQKYECVAFSSNNNSAVLIGNLGLAFGGEPTDEPFVIAVQEHEGDIYGAILDASGTGAATHTVSVSGIATIVNKLDDIFIDTSVPYINLPALGMDAVVPGGNDGYCQVDLSVMDKIVNAAKKGRPVDFKILLTEENGDEETIFRAFLAPVAGSAAAGNAFIYYGVTTYVAAVYCSDSDEGYCNISVDVFKLAVDA